MPPSTESQVSIQRADATYIPDEIQSYIVKLLTVDSGVSPDGRSSHPSKFAAVRKLWAKSVQSITYRECHLVEDSSSESFFGSISSPCLGTPGPGRFVVVFCISVDPGYDEVWWALFKGALPEMINLVTFCFAFTHSRADSIEQYADAARMQLFSPKLETVIARPLECECTEALLLAPPWSHPSFAEHLSWWNTVKCIIIETPAFFIWPPTLARFHQFKNDFTPSFAGCKLYRVVIICAYGTELSDRALGVVGRKLEGTLWEDETEGVNDFYVPQDGFTISNGGVYELFKEEVCGWTADCGSAPDEYTWSNDYDTRIGFATYYAQYFA